jgi:tetratricopeptide (TPR) repeat protein
VKTFPKVFSVMTSFRNKKMDHKFTIQNTQTRPEIKMVSRRAIITKIFIIIMVLAVVGIGSFMLWKKLHPVRTQVAVSQDDLIGQYRSELPDLKKKSESNNPQDLQDYAIAQYAVGDAVGAEQTLRKQISKGGDGAIVHYSLGNALRDQKKTDDAISEYKTAIDKDKSLLSAYFNLGSIYQYSLKDLAKAEDVYKQGIENNPKNADLQVLLGQVYEQKGDIAAARISYEAALAIQSDNASAKAALDRLNASENTAQ